MNDTESKNSYSMLCFVKDPPNICSLVGLLCSFLGIYFALTGKFNLALVGVLWAVVFDWADGRIARRLSNRSEHHREIGKQLDSLIDIVSFSVFPAVFLLSYGNFSPYLLPGAFLIVAGGAVRLSYFNVFGMLDKGTYRGLALDNNLLILSLLFIFERFIPYEVFSAVLYAVMVLLLLLNLADIRTPKFGGRWFYALLAYTVVMSVYLVWLH